MLTMVLLLGVLLLAVTVAGSVTLVEEGQETIGYKNKQLARALATGCMEHALNQLARDAAYAGNEVYILGSTPCTIYPVTVSGGIWTIGVRIDVGMQTMRVKVTLTSQTPIRIDSWREVASWP